MRRKEKRIDDILKIEKIIRRAQVCRLAMTDGDSVYIVPLSFGYQDGVFYFHGAPEGKKIDLLTKSPRVCFELETDVRVTAAKDPCKWGVRFKSVIGWGDASFVTVPEEKRRALQILMDHYTDSHGEFPESAVEKTAVFKVVAIQMTGKQS